MGLTFLNAGESHGKELTAIIQGLPANMPVNVDKINEELKKRQGGPGRGGRMAIEEDKVEITSGVRHAKTLGSPITLKVVNRDNGNWGFIMSPDFVEEEYREARQVVEPRPGHADLVGAIKYGHTDMRNILERSSARETASRVAIGALVRQLVEATGVELEHKVIQVGEIVTANATDEEIVKYIEETKEKGDTLGGIIELRIKNVVPTLGSYISWDSKLDAKIAQAVISINAFKAVEFGDGFEVGKRLGSQVMDEIEHNAEKGFTRKTNHLGGFEGGMTNGEDIIIRAAMKPIPTLMQPLDTVNLYTKEKVKASTERSDVTAIFAAGVVLENVVATTLAQSYLDKFSSDNFADFMRDVRETKKLIKEF
ncbi:MAG: chorismate synthase [Lactobacillales bacterium]|nr:chorismate synthase [Lactobacillales bacterium]